MKKILYWIGYKALFLKAIVFRTPFRHIGKDYFILWNRVVELKWLHYIDCFTYNKTIKHISWTIFHINNETIIDIDNGLKVLFHSVKLRPNIIWYIINNKQYTSELKLFDEWEIEMIIYNFIVTRYNQNWWIMYKIMNLKWEELYTMFDDKWNKPVVSEPDGDFVTITIWNHSKELHMLWIKETI